MGFQPIIVLIKRLKLNILEITIVLFMMITGRSFAESPQLPYIERMEIPKLERLK